MYRRPSAPKRYAHSARETKTGVPPTARKARTGLLTPPGMTRHARSKSEREVGSDMVQSQSIAVLHHDQLSRSAVEHESRGGKKPVLLERPRPHSVVLQTGPDAEMTAKKVSEGPLVENAHADERLRSHRIRHTGRSRREPTGANTEFGEKANTLLSRTKHYNQNHLHSHPTSPP